MEYGTAVSVQCEGNLKLLGSDVVYCKEGINYIYSSRPSCVDPGEYRTNDGWGGGGANISHVITPPNFKRQLILVLLS